MNSLIIVRGSTASMFQQVMTLIPVMQANVQCLILMEEIHMQKDYKNLNRIQ